MLPTYAIGKLTQVPGRVGRWGRYALYWDAAQNAVQVGRGGWDIYQNGLNWSNGLQVGVGLLGLGGNYIIWRRLKAESDEYRHYIGQGFTPAQAQYLTQPYKGMGHHYIPRRTLKRLGAPKWLQDCCFNVLKPRGISIGKFYELHYMVDPHFNAAAFPRYIGGLWHGEQLGLKKYGPWSRWWHGMLGPTKVVGGAVVVGGGAAGVYWLVD